MKNLNELHLMNVEEISAEKGININGGFWHVVVGVIGCAAGAAYLYEFGYNMVDKAFTRAKK